MLQMFYMLTEKKYSKKKLNYLVPSFEKLVVNSIDVTIRLIFFVKQLRLIEKKNKKKKEEKEKFKRKFTNTLAVSKKTIGWYIFFLCVLGILDLMSD